MAGGCLFVLDFHINLHKSHRCLESWHNHLTPQIARYNNRLKGVDFPVMCLKYLLRYYKGASGVCVIKETSVKIEKEVDTQVNHETEI